MAASTTDGTLTINNSTLSGNGRDSVTRRRRYLQRPGTLTINNSTISGNSALGYGGGIYDSRHDDPPEQHCREQLLGGNCYGTMTSNGYNLSSDDTCNFNSTGDLNNTDPKLGTLGNYGGRHRLCLCSLEARRSMRATRVAAPMATVIC